MGASLYWMHAGGCGGDTMSLLNATSPNVSEAMTAFEIEVLWHPSFSTLTPPAHKALLDELQSGTRPLDILCVEGAVVTGPEGSGGYDMLHGRPRMATIAALAAKARFVIGVGTCAAFGGISGAGETEAVGLQFNRRAKGGLLGPEFTAASGLRVINIPGCPIHPVPLIGTIDLLLRSVDIALNDYNAPLEYFSMLVHQGCTRNEYHEYQVEETDFGERGCLFFHLGCHGPLAHGPCNKFLWNGRSCKTRSGVPCSGCTEPDFPQKTPFFETPNIVGLPINLPDGVDRPHYLAYKGMAAAAAPERLRHRKTKV